LRLVIGISEGIVLADRYRLVRRQIERGIGATWVAADTETGSDVWVQFADHGGLEEAARFLGEHQHPAIPAVLDTGELRLVVDSRALAAPEGRAAPHATHVEIVIEFAVLKPVTGRSLPAKIARRALAPAEALAIVAALAGALELARAEGRSHGWVTADSVWLVRRGGCAVDLALGLAFPDGTRIEVEQAVTGYFAPERLGTGREGSGAGASEAADVFALGWMLYEALIGHAALQAEYTRLVAAAGAVTTLELLTLWRARARAHVAELVEAGSALGLLLAACLQENPAARPGLAAFGSGALEAASGMAGIGPLVQFAARGARHAATKGEVAADEAAALVVGAALGMTAAEAAADVVGGEAVAVGEAGSQAEETQTPETQSGQAQTAGAQSAQAQSAETQSAQAQSAQAQSAEAETAEAQIAETEFAETASVGAMAAATGGRHPGRNRVLIGSAAAGVLAVFAVGLIAGYQWGHGSGSPGSSTQAGAAPGSVVAAGAGAGTACASPAASASAEAAAAVTSATPAASATPAPASPSPATTPALAGPTSNASAIAELGQAVTAAQASGAISASEAATLSGAVGRIRATGSGTGEYTLALRNLGNLVQNGREQGAIPLETANELASVLSYLYGPAGS
jgi:hypothetical protein